MCFTDQYECAGNVVGNGGDGGGTEIGDGGGSDAGVVVVRGDIGETVVLMLRCCV